MASKWNSPDLQPFIVQDLKPTGKVLGEGSFGSVEEAEIPGALCVIKKLHEALLPPPTEARGADRMATNFVQECRLMSTLRHPHIVQFLGVCFLPKAKLPALVMEKLDTDLHNLLEINPGIPLSLKHHILLGVARGLIYLHSRNPPIIHRDLTARNVLLNSAMEAKIADLGNFRTIQPNQSKTLTKNPGNMYYMPPEAQEDVARYNSTVDIFSFGHLTLFTLTQKFPDLKAATYSQARRVIARSEVQRRDEGFQAANRELGANHSLVQLAKDCLNNGPEDRPPVAAIVRRLEQFRADDSDLALENKLRVLQSYRSVKQQNQDFTKTLDEKQTQIKAQQKQIKDQQKHIEDQRKQVEQLQASLMSARQEVNDCSREVRQQKAVVKAGAESEMQLRRDVDRSRNEMRTMRRFFHELQDLHQKASDKLLEAEHSQLFLPEDQHETPLQDQIAQLPADIQPHNPPGFSKPPLTRSISLTNQETTQRQPRPLPVPQAAPRHRPQLPRSISQTNLETTQRCRAEINQDWESDAPPGGTNFFTTTPSFTLTLPSLEGSAREFRQFVFDWIIDKQTQLHLEEDSCLNWCDSATKFVPICTMGDGNSLLHAASLGMWGFQDRGNILRNAVSHAVRNHHGNTLYRRWKYTRDVDNQQSGIQLDDHQWMQEWDMIVQQASTDVNEGANLDSLEEFHVFVLANILRRPIIMYASAKMRSAHGSTLQRQNFHGVHLPLLWDPDSCKKHPLPLAFNAGHFSALVIIESPEQYVDGSLLLPLTDYFGQQLPVRFAVPQEDPTSLLMDYLKLRQVEKHKSPYISRVSILCAEFNIQEAPAYLKPLINGFIEACSAAFSATQPLQQPQPQRPNERQFQSQGGGEYPPQTPSSDTPGPQGGGAEQCIEGCGRFGSPDTMYMCEPCYRQAQNAALSRIQQPPKMRTLCRTAGCSYKGYSDLGGYCPDCYQGEGHGTADPIQYPLV